MVVTSAPVQGTGSFQLSSIQPETSSRNAIRTSITIPRTTIGASSNVRE
jgi:hypothetical protein